MRNGNDHQPRRLAESNCGDQKQSPSTGLHHDSSWPLLEGVMASRIAEVGLNAESLHGGWIRSSSERLRGIRGASLAQGASLPIRLFQLRRLFR